MATSNIACLRAWLCALPGVIYMTCAIIPWGRAYGQCSVDEIREFLSRIAGTVWAYFPKLAMMRTQQGFVYTRCRRVAEILALPSEVPHGQVNAPW